MTHTKGFLSILLLSSVFVFFISSSQSSNLPKDLLNSYYDGRSGDIVIYDKDATQTLGSVSFINAPKFPSTVSKVDETEVADLISHFMTLSPLQSNRSRDHFPSASFFNTPKVNVFFNIELPTYRSFSTFSNAQTFPVNRESYSPNSALSHLTSIFSAVTPSVHGIIADSWVDRVYGISSVTNAYDSWSSGTSYSANIADMFTLTYGGKSLVMSMSSKKEVSRAMSAKPFVLDDSASGNFGFYLNGDVFDSVYPSSLAKVLMNKETVRVFFLDAIPCGFSLDNQADFELLAEVAFAKSLNSILTAPGSEFHKYISDEVPDLFSIGFSSLKSIAATYGQEGAQMSCAVELVDGSIKSVVELMSTLYGEESVLVEGVVLVVSGVDVDQVKATTDAVSKTESIAMKKEVKDLWPNLYLFSEMTQGQKEQLSTSLTESLSTLHLKAEVMPHTVFAEMKNSYKLVESLRQSADNSTGISEMEVFQTLLWSSIGLGAAAVAGSYIMTTIDPSTDALLYNHDINHPAPKSN